MRLPAAASRDWLLVFAAACVAGGLAIHYGWINRDALCYIEMAKSMMQGHLPTVRPSWGNRYFAVFPPGYPFSMAVVASLLPLGLVVASKLLNIGFLIGSVGLAASVSGLPLLVAAAFFFTVQFLDIFSFTASENPFFFCVFLSIYALRGYITRGKASWLALYFFAMLGCFLSRYIGGFCLISFGLMSLLAWRANPSKRTVMAVLTTGLAVVVFIAYLAINKHVTGDTTGQHRLPAPEPELELVTQWLIQLAKSALVMLPGAALLAWRKELSLPQWRSAHFSTQCLIIYGALYLLILLAIRSVSFFDPFMNRLMMPGALMLWVGFLRLCYQPSATPRKGTGFGFVLLTTLALSLLYAGVTDYLTEPKNRGLAEAEAQFEAHYGAVPDGSVIIAASLPHIAWRVHSPLLNTDKVWIIFLPDERLTLKQLKYNINQAHYQGGPAHKVLFDFTPYQSMKDLDGELHGEANATPEVVEWMHGYFAPGQLVECTDCLDTATP